MSAVDFKCFGSLMILLLSSSLSLAQVGSANGGAKNAISTQDLKLQQFQGKLKGLVPTELKNNNQRSLEPQEMHERLYQRQLKRGGITDGGGNATADGDLFDFYENEGTDVLVFSNFDSFTRKVAPLLLQIEKNIPGLGEKLGSYLSSKKWYLEPKPLNNESCQNGSFIEANKIVVACQDEFEVRIYKAWFLERADQNQEKLLLNQAGLITHELLVGYLMDLGLYAESEKATAERSVRALNRELYSGSINFENLVLEFNKRLKLHLESTKKIQAGLAEKEAMKTALLQLDQQEYQVLLQINQWICVDKTRDYIKVEKLIQEFYPADARARLEVQFSPRLVEMLASGEERRALNSAMILLVPRSSHMDRDQVCRNIKKSMDRVLKNNLNDLAKN